MYFWIKELCQEPFGKKEGGVYVHICGKFKNIKLRLFVVVFLFSLNILIVHSYNLNEYKRSCTESYGGNQRIKLVVVIKLYYIFI